MSNPSNSTRGYTLSRRALLAGISTGAFFVMSGRGRAQHFAPGPVKFVVGIGAGSSPDVVCRRMADELSRPWGAQATVLNQPGGTGGIAMRTVGTSAPDGRTLLFALSSSFVALPEIQSKFPYDLARDFVPVGLVGEVPMAIAASASLGVNTLAEFIAAAKQRPGQIGIAVTNRGGTPHLTAEWLRMAASIDVTAVSYRGAQQGLTDLIGGRVQATVGSLPGMRPAIESGSLKLLAVCARQRLPNLLDVATATETLPGFISVGWYAVMAPPGTPESIAHKISVDLRTVLEQAELRSQFESLGFYVRPMSPAELLEFINHEKKAWKPVIERIGLQG